VVSKTVLVSCSAYYSTLKMEATCSSETSADFQRTTWRYIQEYNIWHSTAWIRNAATSKNSTLQITPNARHNTPYPWWMNRCCNRIVCIDLYSFQTLADSRTFPAKQAEYLADTNVLLFFPRIVLTKRAHHSIVGWGTMLQAGRSRVWFPMRSLHAFN
jgi:hypothetical protein